METNTVDLSKSEKQVHCAPSQNGQYCINADGTPVVDSGDSGSTEREITDMVETVPVIPVETLETQESKQLVSCASCSSIGTIDSAVFSFALIVPLIIKSFKSI